MDKALKIFHDMIAHGCERNVITYSSLINACEKSGRWQLALQLFDDMQRDGCHPNVVSYNVLVSTCAQGEPACAAGGFTTVVPATAGIVGPRARRATTPAVL